MPPLRHGHVHQHFDLIRAQVTTVWPAPDGLWHVGVNAFEQAAHSTGSSATAGEARLRRLVTDLERSYPSAAACLAEDLPALCVHLEYPLRLRKRLRSTNLLERSLEEVKRRTKVIGRFPGETRCLSLCFSNELHGDLVALGRVRGAGSLPSFQ